MTSTEAQPDIERGRRLQPFASFRYRGYPWLWAANVCFALSRSAQGLVLGWLVFDMSGSFTALGLVTITVALPALLFALPAGVFADRRDRRLLLATSHIVVGLALLLLAVLYGAGLLSLSLAALVALLIGIGLAVGEPVRRALIPAIVPANRLLNANALDGLGQGIGAIGGSVLAIVGADYLGLEFPILVSIVAVFAGALFVIPLRVPPREPLPTSAEYGISPRQPTSEGMWGDIADVFDFIAYSTTQVGPLFLLLLTVSILGPWLALEGWEVGNRLDVTVTGTGVLFMVMGLGSLAALLTLMSIPRLRNAGGWYVVALVIGAMLTPQSGFPPATH